jgi:acyl-CoA reductase-like NAD-dependent aldehyde dehydrogenase
MSTTAVMHSPDPTLDSSIVPSMPVRASQVQSKQDAQPAWAALSVRSRVQVLRRARFLLAAASAQLADAIPATLDRSRADTLAAEVLPLLAACQFLEREAHAILRTRRLGRSGLPFWLAGVTSEVQRVPFGRVLIIAPGNYPLFLAGTQTLQALAAGNAVVWKPGRGGRAVALVVAEALTAAGLPHGLLRVTDDTISAAEAELDARPDVIVFTGSARAGREVLRRAAQTATPVIAELSGCDAAFILPSAHPAHVLDALTFGMRLNGSATCMAPRRLILIGEGHELLLANLRDRLAAMSATPLTPPILSQLRELLADARQQGASILGEPGAASTKPILILNAKAQMEIAQADLFAPVLTVLHASTVQEAIALDKVCPFGLTASIFGDESAARLLAASLTVGTVTINDLIVPTADPRVPFTARRGSGFGATRGREGLLAMTVPKVISAPRSKSRRHLAPTSAAHEALFTAVITAQHAPTLRQRLAGAAAMVKAATRIK